MASLRRLPAPQHVREQDLVDDVLRELEPYFYIDREVRGTHCTGRPVRVDAVLRPIDYEHWKDAEPALAVEFKTRQQRRFDTRDFTAWVAQAVDYTHVEWDDFGRLPIFVSPSPMETMYGPLYGEEAARLMVHVLGSLGVGELVNIERRGWSFVMQENHVIWSQVKGLEHGARWGLKPKVGSR